MISHAEVKKMLVQRLRLVGLSAVAVLAFGCSDPETAKQRHFESGNRYVEAEQHAEAVVEYRNAIQRDPLFGEARLALAETYERMGNAQGAYNEYIRAADLLPDNTTAQLKATTFLLLARRFEDARARVEKLLAREPENVDAQILLGTALSSLRDFDGAITQIEEAIGLDPARGLSYANLAAVHAAQGNEAEARKAFERAVDIDPASIQSWLALANFQLATGAVAEAEASLKRALALEPGHMATNRALAAIYMSTNRAADAESYLKAFVAAANTAAARLQLADYYVGVRRNTEARDLLRQMSSDLGPTADVEARLAQLEYADRQTANAHAILDRALGREPNNIPLLLMKSRWLLLEGKIEEALARANDAVRVDPTSVNALYLLGSVQMVTRDVAGATRSFNEVLRLNPRASAAQLQLSRLLLASGDVDTSVQHADAVLRSVPGNPDARVALARGLIARGDSARAGTEVNALLKEFPNVAVVHLVNGNLMALNNRAPQARTAFERALALDPASLEAMAGIIAVDVQAGRTAQARAFIDRQLAASPNRSELMVLAARVYATDRDIAAAEQALRRAIAIDASNTTAYGLLGQALLSQRKLDEARAEFDEVVRRTPGNLAAATMAAMIVEAQQNTSDAKKRYMDILAANPRAGVAANNLAWLYAEEGTNLDQALQLAQVAVSVMPDRPEAQDTLGWVYYRRELPSLAIAPFEQAILKDARNPIYHYHLALALARSGEITRARQSAEMALKLNPNHAEARRLLESL